MPETTNGLPYPPGTGVLPDVPYWMQQLAEALDILAANPEPTFPTPTAAWGEGYVRVKRRGVTVMVNVDIALGSASNSGEVLVTGLPSPDGGSAIWSGEFVISAGGGTPAQAQLSNAGTLTVYWPSGPGATARLRGTLTYLADGVS